MVHTATLTYRPTAELYDTLKSQAHFDKILKQWVCSTYSNQGITIYAYFTYGSFHGDHFVCRVNFHKLVDPNDRITVYTNAEYTAMADNFNRIMDELGGLPHLEEWQVRRIDYCVNVRTPYVKEYIKLMKKGDMPYSQDLPYDRKTRKRRQQPGSVYYPSKVYDSRKKKTGSFTINFYDKYDECQKKGVTGEALEQAREILRLEVQCHRPKLDTVRNRYALPDRRVNNLLDPEIGLNILRKAVKDVSLNADYLRRSVAIARVYDTTHRKTTKNRMIRIINEVATQHQSVWKIRDKLYTNGEMTKESFNACLSKLRDANINPVTISDNQSIPQIGYKDGLPNVVTLFEASAQQAIYLDDEFIENIDDIL